MPGPPTLPPADSYLPRDLSAIVPEAYADYRGPLRASLAFFLDRLDPARQRLLLAEQAALPPGTPDIDRVLRLLHACPSLHKLGQVVARDRRLDAELRRRLAELESLPGHTPLAALREVLGAELGAEAATLELEPPLAEGSVCAVVPFRRTGHDVDASSSPDAGVLKIVKPGVEDRLAEELALWPGVGARLEELCREAGLDSPDWEGAVGQVAELLAREVDLGGEQRNLDEAGSFFADDRRVLVPQRLEPCTPRVTAMTRLPGTPVTAFRGGRLRRARLAATVVESLVARPLLAPEGPSLFHADPHAGNLLASGDRRLGIVDWSLVGHLSKEDRVQATQIIVGALTLDRRRIARAVERMAVDAVDADTLRTAIDDALAEVRRGTPPGVGWTSRFLDRLVTSRAARFPGHLLLFRKSLLTLAGVLADISRDVPADLVLAGCVARQVARDSPRRLLSGPFRRHYGSHLSNLELLALLGAPTLTTLRFWRQTLRSRLR